MGFFLFLSVCLVAFLLKAYHDENQKNKNLRNQVAQLIDEASRLKSDIKLYADDEHESKLANDVLKSAVENLANHFVNDSFKFIDYSVTANNLETSLKKADRVFQVLEELNIRAPEQDVKNFKDKIRNTFTLAVKKDEAKRQQQLIKDQIREEQRAQAEHDAEVKSLEKTESQLADALEKAKRKFKDEHSAEVEELKRQLAEATEKKERIKSQAELTKAGHVYVISNIGSFGKDIYKVGMTRRLEPMDRVKELSDASVPFPFDVHMMISCDDAPMLESRLHEELNAHRVNQVNLQKEFFKVSIDQIASLIQKSHGKITYKATAEAFEYYESLAAIENAQKSNKAA